MTTFFTGCSNNESKNEGTTEIMFFSNKIEAVGTYNKLVEKFEAENPNIKVTISAPPDATTVLKTKLVKGDVPDIISMSADRSYADFVEANIFKSVENVNLSTVIAYKEKGIKHHFLDDYDNKKNGDGEGED